MTLLTRLGRLFRADLHAVLDRLEEPAELLKEALREMEAVVSAEALEAAHLADELARSEAHAATRAEDARRLEAELALCLEAGDDALARTVVRRQLVLGERERRAQRHLHALHTAQAALAPRRAEHQRRLDELRQHAALIDPPTVAGADPAAGAEGLEVAIDEDSVTVALLRAKRARGAP